MMHCKTLDANFADLLTDHLVNFVENWLKDFNQVAPASVVKYQ